MKIGVVVLFEDIKLERDKAEEAIKREHMIVPLISGHSLDDASWFFGENLIGCEAGSYEGKCKPGYSHLENLSKSVTLSKGYGTLGVITDVMMPVVRGGRIDPVGILIAVTAKKKGIPVVVCTSDSPGHPSWVATLLKKLEIPVIVGKDWGSAVKTLREIMLK